MKSIKVVITILSLLSILPADVPDQNATLDSAIQAMHNLQYDRSGQLFGEVARTDNNNIYAPLGQLIVEWYKMMGLYGNQFNKQILLQKSEALEAFYKNKLSRTPRDPDLNLCLALAIGFKSRIVISEKNSFYVMFNGVKTLKYLRRCDELTDDHPDLEFCKGVFEYYVSKYPGIIKYFANMFLENTGDRERGRQRIRYAAGADGFLKYDANFLLAFIYLYIENQPAKAVEHIRLLVDKFPKNPNYHFLRTFANLQLNNITTAEKNLNEYIASMDEHNPYYKDEFINRTDFLTALLTVKKKEYDRAMDYFQKFTENYELELEHLMAIALLEQGKIQDFKGDHQAARKFYKRVLEIDNETYPVQLARQYLVQ